MSLEGPGRLETWVLTEKPEEDKRLGIISRTPYTYFWPEVNELIISAFLLLDVRVHGLFYLTLLWTRELAPRLRYLLVSWSNARSPSAHALGLVPCPCPTSIFRPPSLKPFMPIQSYYSYKFKLRLRLKLNLGLDLDRSPDNRRLAMDHGLGICPAQRYSKKKNLNKHKPSVPSSKIKSPNTVMTAGPILCVSPYAWVLPSVSPCSILHARLVRPSRRRKSARNTDNVTRTAKSHVSSFLLLTVPLAQRLSAVRGVACLAWPGFALLRFAHRACRRYPVDPNRPPSPLLNQLVPAPELFYNHPIFLKHSSSQPSQPE
ncbi:uncharacterized protein CLUP02_00771 [Colletotrichum lupini]|uniref:Uncharacterized protein n=1 Tax=Colletotrichum lupini TaxID=145971 RepID=A0A9Q8W8I9_9PEZI|nr:uncharacterized protein CLUP02_00771 [Colletotrichum lupini]UQC74124.1 hypothetical protein CLUP02_00771 [Colletotrichum lupini]